MQYFVQEHGQRMAEHQVFLARQCRTCILYHRREDCEGASVATVLAERDLAVFACELRAFHQNALAPKHLE